MEYIKLNNGLTNNGTRNNQNFYNSTPTSTQRYTPTTTRSYSSGR